MTDSPWPDRFEMILRRHLPLLGNDPIDGDRLLTKLGLDSLAIVSVTVDIEDEFEVEFPDDYLNLQTFGTAGTLWAAVDLLSSHECGTERSDAPMIVDEGAAHN